MIKEALLYQPLADSRVRCTACARYCNIPEGKIGFCGVRQNIGGKLHLLVYGKVITGHIDPIEKKPVTHYMPGSKIFSIATTGCSWLCHYCFTPQTAVLTDSGIRTIEEIYDHSDPLGEVGYPRNLRVLTHTGSFRTVQKAFRHRYAGKVFRIHPYYFPEFSCTPNHKIFVLNQETGTLEKKRADELNTRDLLAIPTEKDSIVSTCIDSYELLSSSILNMNRVSKRKSAWMLVNRDGRVKFKLSRSRGIPRTIPIDENLAELLGLYAAEGSSTKDGSRPNSWTVTMAFGKHETQLVERTEELFAKVFGLKPSRVVQNQVLRLEVHNNALGILLHTMMGGDCYSKRVPVIILHNNSRGIQRSFLRGYVAGDGFKTGSNGQKWIGTTSVSRVLSLGVWYLMFRLGMTPRFYMSSNPSSYEIEGRLVNRHNDYMTRVMVTTDGRTVEAHASKTVEKEGYTLVQIRTIQEESYTGFVYNLEVDADHSYLANFISVSNCQNFDISQRRMVEGMDMMPLEVATLAVSHGCQGLAYTYNQPTIFMEFAHDVGVEARRNGLINIFVSNGYDTPDTVGMMNDFLDCVTIDFKGNAETNFVRKYIGIANAEPIFQTILEIRNKTKVHMEFTDLVIPEVGDNLDDARKLSRWMYDNLGPDHPIHFLRFHPDYKMMNLPHTPVKTLEEHCRVAREEGLRYVYVGNVPGHPWEHTYCPECNSIAIKRYGFDITSWNLDENNRCANCGYQLPIVGGLSSSISEERFLPVIN